MSINRNKSHVLEVKRLIPRYPTLLMWTKGRQRLGIFWLMASGGPRETVQHGYDFKIFFTHNQSIVINPHSE
jgi:hypothetical protein